MRCADIWSCCRLARHQVYEAIRDLLLSDERRYLFLSLQPLFGENNGISSTPECIVGVLKPLPVVYSDDQGFRVGKEDLVT